MITIRLVVVLACTIFIGGCSQVIQHDRVSFYQSCGAFVCSAVTIVRNDAGQPVTLVTHSDGPATVAKTVIHGGTEVAVEGMKTN